MPSQSESIAALAAALAKAQGAIKAAVKDSSNPHFKSRYADLASVWEACRRPLSENGLAVIQTTDEVPDGTAVLLVTTLVHASGEWIAGRLRLNPVKPDPQGMGSAITYARRYALAAIVGIAPDDDDGEAAQGRQGQQANGNGYQQKPPDPRTAAISEIARLAKEAGVKATDIPAELAEIGMLPEPLPSNKWTEGQVAAALNYFREAAAAAGAGAL